MEEAIHLLQHPNCTKLIVFYYISKKQCKLQNSSKNLHFNFPQQNLPTWKCSHGYMA